MSRQTANIAPIWPALACGMASSFFFSAAVSTVSAEIRAPIAFTRSSQKVMRSGMILLAGGVSSASPRKPSTGRAVMNGSSVGVSRLTGRGQPPELGRDGVSGRLERGDLGGHVLAVAPGDLEVALRGLADVPGGLEGGDVALPAASAGSPSGRSRAWGTATPTRTCGCRAPRRRPSCARRSAVSFSYAAFIAGSAVRSSMASGS